MASVKDFEKYSVPISKKVKLSRGDDNDSGTMLIALNQLQYITNVSYLEENVIVKLASKESSETSNVKIVQDD